MVHQGFLGNRRPSGNEIHIWQAVLDVPETCLARLSGTLSPGERRRALRFRFERDRRRCAAGRGILREILGFYLGTDAAAIRISYTEYGKPYLEPQWNHAVLSFNTSHSEALALYVFTASSQIGVDVEYVREVPELADIAAHCFSRRERSLLENLPPKEKQDAFFKCWTRKEAFVKAVGRGLSTPLDSFEVLLHSDLPAHPSDTHSECRPPRGWTIVDLDVPRGFAAALAVERADVRPAYFRWPDDLPRTFPAYRQVEIRQKQEKPCPPASRDAAFIPHPATPAEDASPTHESSNLDHQPRSLRLSREPGIKGDVPCLRFAFLPA